MSTNIAAYITGNSDHSEISRLDLFKGVNLLSIHELLSTCPMLVLEAGEILASPGEPNQVVHLLLRGRLHVHQDSLESEPTSTIESGKCVGVLPLFDRRPCSQYVVADQESRLLVVDEDRLMELINSSHAVARNCLCTVMQELRQQGSPELEKKDLQKKYQRVSSMDDLTGVHNRRWLDEMLTRQIMRSATAQQALSVTMVALDNFKEFNNDFGKNIGDQALYTLAQTIMKNARPTDMTARYEGNRFVIVLPGSNIDGARHFAARLREAVGETNIVVPDQCILPSMTISLGIVEMKAFVSAEGILLDAAAALARARDKGGNWVSE
jgi:diguanylate cyclase (GGDEF)-like protein